MKCKICSNPNLKLIVDMGEMPLANSFTADGECERYPLEVYYCDECCLIQIANDIDPNSLFTNYPYRSSASVPLAEHFETMANHLKFLMSDDDLIVDIGCNDGVLLRNFVGGDQRILGIDPALNFQEDLKDQEIPVITDFFDSYTAKKIVDKHGQAKFIFASNVVAHVMDLHELMRGIRELLHPYGMFILEVHSLSNLLDSCCYDQIYHEHRCYFSLHAIKNLLSQYDFEIVDVDIVNTHGSTMRVACKHKVSNASIDVKSVSDMLEYENQYLNFKAL